MNKSSYISLGVVAGMFLIIGGLFTTYKQESVKLSSHKIINSPSIRVLKPEDRLAQTQTTVYDKINKGENLFHTLRRLRLNKIQAERFVNKLGVEINLRALRAGSVVKVTWEPVFVSAKSSYSNRSDGLASLVSLFVKDDLGVAQEISAERDIFEDQISTHIVRQNIYSEHTLISGAVQSSIYQAIISKGGSDGLVNSFSDVFAWQFDFFRETRSGDSYQIIVEKNMSEGRFIGYGRVLAAEYLNHTSNLRGFYFESQDGKIKDFFDQDGKSLRNAFLKTPIKLASISSKFGVRFHPIEKRYKPHNGVDYGAPRGTPIMAVADGRVTRAGYTRFNGNYLFLRHLNNYETIYLHATRLASKIYVGARVKQGQVIAYVGKTGHALGYHLHFGMKKNGKYVNPARQIFARAAGVPQKQLSEFKQKIQPFIIALNNTLQKQGAQVAGLDNNKFDYD